MLYNNCKKEGSVGMKIFAFLMVIKIAVQTIWVNRMSGNMPIILGLVSTILISSEYYIFNTIIVLCHSIEDNRQVALNLLLYSRARARACVCVFSC